MSSSETNQKQAPSTLSKISPTVYVITMNQKLIDLPLILSINEHLDTLDEVKGPMSLITTSSNEKVYNTGFDLKIFAQPKHEVQSFLMLFNKLLSRFLQLGYPTLACLNGHCYAGGLMFAMTHDFRFKSSDKGNVCMNEVDIGVPFAPGLITVYFQKLTPDALRRLIVFGEVFTPEKALEAGIVDKIQVSDKLLETSKEFLETVAPKSRHRIILADIKRVLYEKAIHAAETKFLPDPGMMK